MTNRVRAANAGLKVAGFSASCRRYVRMANNGISRGGSGGTAPGGVAGAKGVAGGFVDRRAQCGASKRKGRR
jgi:hypothetical protein